MTAQRRCNDCGGLWDRREHEEWCRRYRAPQARVAATSPMALDIDGRDYLPLSTCKALPTVGWAAHFRHEVWGSEGKTTRQMAGRS